MVALTAEQIAKYHADGYLVLEKFLDDADVERLVDSCRRLVDGFDPLENHCTFTTADNKQSRDEYFLESGDKIRYFLEEDAIDTDGRLVVDKSRCLNKIGHALHWLEPEFRRVTFGQNVKDAVRSLGFVDPVVAQSMYIFKPPRIGGQVTPHQDSTFLHTQPMNIVGVWLALQDVTLENGCLWFVPGSQRNGIGRRFVRNADPESTQLTKIVGSDPPVDDSQFVAAPVAKGSCVLIHGEVVHKSEKNLSAASRHAYTFHVLEQADTVYSTDNWLQPTPQLPFPSLYREN